MNYAVGLIGMWLFTDGIFSIITCVRFNPQKINSWRWDHSIRIIRMVVGVAMMVLGAVGGTQ